MHKLMATAVLLAACGLAATAPGQEARDVYTDNVVIVLDASGSMNDSMGDAQGGRVRKIDAARSALLQVLRHIRPTTHVGVLVFSAGNVSDPWIYPLGPRDDAKLGQAVRLPQPQGNTPLGTYMRMGKDRLLAQRKAQFGYGTYRLLVVTDGEANSEPADLVDRCTVEMLTAGIIVDVIGVAMAQRHALATKAHSYRAANNPESLARAVGEVFAEVGAKGGGDAAASAIFAELGGIPDAVAVTAIQALTGGAAGEGPPARPDQVPPPSAPAARQASGPNSALYVLVIGGLGLLFLLILVASKSRSGKWPRRR